MTTPARGLEGVHIVTGGSIVSLLATVHRRHSACNDWLIVGYRRLVSRHSATLEDERQRLQ